METLLHRASQRSRAAHNLMADILGTELPPDEPESAPAPPPPPPPPPPRPKPPVETAAPQNIPRSEGVVLSVQSNPIAVFNPDDTHTHSTSHYHAQSPATPPLTASTPTYGISSESQHTPQTQLVETVTMSTPSDTSSWRGRPESLVESPRNKDSPMGLEEEQEMREAMHWRALAAEHIGLTPQQIGMPVLPPSPEFPPAALGSAALQAQSLQLGTQNRTQEDQDSLERALSKAQSMLQLEVRRCQEIRAESERSAAEMRKELSAANKERESECVRLREQLDHDRSACREAQEECESMKHQLEDAREEVRELHEAQDESPKQSGQLLSELQEMLAAERALTASLRAEKIVLQNNHSIDLQAAYQRFQENSRQQLEESSAGRKVGKDSPPQVRELAHKLQRAQQGQEAAEKAASQAALESGNFAAIQALRAERQLQQAVSEARAAATQEVVEEIERKSAAILSGMPQPPQVSVLSFPASPVVAVQQMVSDCQGPESVLSTLSAAVACLSKEREQLVTKYSASMRALEEQLKSTRSKREKALLHEVAALKEQLDDAAAQRTIEHDMRRYYIEQLEQAHMDAAKSEAERAGQITLLREEVGALTTKLLQKSSMGSPTQLYRFATQQLLAPPAARNQQQ
eukprot:TRINITY_DN1039_c0_g1_i1.p1 TRINITY_DN1039_c0_g1~~TRINITY_DN1039_c0_g1_i1.p1  ORF type:complete len:635 (-),score=205.90 TRINITY_DN1039_c0_g1_i1:349-2253(-)